MNLSERGQIGPYRLVRLIAKGGMGEVYEALDVALSRRVAIKVVSEELLDDHATLERFTIEARTLARLSHPNIVTLYAYGSDQLYRYLVMELVEGEPLSRIMARGVIPVPTALSWFEGMAGGVAAVHDAGVIHRDIKPENILIRNDDCVKLTDFGLARNFPDEQPHLTVTGTIIGTIDFLAPELLKGEPATVRSDIYALGIVLYGMVTGKPLFGTENPLLKLRAIREQALPPVGALNPAVSPALEAVVCKLCHKRPALRYATLYEALEDLRRATGQAVDPPRAPFPRPAAPPPVNFPSCPTDKSPGLSRCASNRSK